MKSLARARSLFGHLTKQTDLGLAQHIKTYYVVTVLW